MSEDDRKKLKSVKQWQDNASCASNFHLAHLTVLTGLQYPILRPAQKILEVTVSTSHVTTWPKT
jgi:hypothetical protein